MNWHPAPHSTERLATEREIALKLLNSKGLAVELDVRLFQAFLKEGGDHFDELLSQSEQLLTFGADSISTRTALTTARFLGGPPISNDDLERLVGRTAGSRTLSEEFSTAAVPILRALFDQKRLPWLPDRVPSAVELNLARTATATLYATERFRTARRTASKRLELLTSAALVESGLKLVEGRHTDLPWSLPAGTFCEESTIMGTKCDRPAHVLQTKVALLIECKDSSTEINGTKRLKSIKEAAETWRRAFGGQVLTVAMIAGAYKLEDLEATQRDGIYIIWEHNMDPLKQLLASLLNSTQA